MDATYAAIASAPETVALAPMWLALRDQADAHGKARMDADRALSRARARLAVADAKWDTTVAAFGRAVVDASGGRREQAPYTRFFGKVTPSTAQTFGVQREIDTATGWLTDSARASGFLPRGYTTQPRDECRRRAAGSPCSEAVTPLSQ